jgi:NAD(P)-dependent dehydrogenase (short-subunit alcohol dehydrogenase family)
MDLPGREPDTLVTGATGHIGRWLAAELLSRGRSVAVTVRGGRARGEDLRTWLRERHIDDRALTVVPADITRPGLGVAADDEAVLRSVRDVFNAAALYRFGLGRDEAYQANVQPVGADRALGHRRSGAVHRPGGPSGETLDGTAARTGRQLAYVPPRRHRGPSRAFPGGRARARP